MIRLESVSKVYKNHGLSKSVCALKGISFEVKEGEFICILGPSGCGKSTLIDLIAGFSMPTSGDIIFEGTRISCPSPERIVVFQDHNLLEWKTVLSNIEFGLKAKGVSFPESSQIARRFVDMVHLNGFEYSYPYQLSGGMKQRVVLARALAVDPGCILMDEPLGSLDPQMREKLQVEILSLWEKTHKTILMVTHDMEEAVFLAQRILVMGHSPGVIHKVINVDLDHPREPAVKMTKKFQDIKRELWEILKG